MLRTLENIIGYRILARDGEVGKVRDFYMDDSLWKLRYVVADTGNWMSRRRVLISLTALGRLHADRREFSVNLSSEQVRTSPDIATDQPVSRQQEMAMNAHYGWPAYWSPEVLVVPEPIAAILNRRRTVEGDAHLRSFREVSSYALTRGEEKLGKVVDFVIDDSDWSLKRLVVAEGGWFDSRFRTIAAKHITEISWSDRTVSVDPNCLDLEPMEAFDYGYPANREDVEVYFDYYGRPTERPGAVRDS